jgi:hypothetical protein
MKKILLLFLLICSISNAQIVNIPDANFKNTLLSNSAINTNNNAEIELSEALSVTNLNVSSSSIANLTGISSFSNLQILDCSHNDLTFLDVSALTNLTKLVCSFNQISNAFDFSSNPSLTYLDCNNNVISGINFSSLVSLQWMDCSYNSISDDVNFSGNLNLVHWNSTLNPIASINLSNCTSLSYFEHSDAALPFVVLNNLNLSGCTSLTGQLLSNVAGTVNVSGCSNLTTVYLAFCDEINISGCTSLQAFGIEGCFVETLDFSGFTNLTIVEIGGGTTSSINFSGCNSLSNLYLGSLDITSVDLSFTNNLTHLELSNNLQLQYLYLKNGNDDPLTLMNCPNLEFICVDDSEIDYYSNLISQLGYTTQINSYCSFVPGGNYNTITGTVTFDQNSDGCDASDLPKSYLRINLNDGSTIPKHTYTTSNGNYSIYTLTGNFTLTPQIENPSWFSFTPSSSTIPFSTLGNTMTQNFCFSPIGIHNDIEIVITPVATARPGFDAFYQIVYRNKGNQMVSGTVNFTFEDALLDFITASTIPTTQSTGNLSWNYINLMPFESRIITLSLNVNSPTETPAVNIGDVLHFGSAITSVTSDEYVIDNNFSFNQTVVGSYDPNDKTCLEGTIAPTIKIGDYLHYTINFENTGTAPATFVVVKDLIDTAKFDISSLQVMHSSHLMETRINGNKVEFIFDNINLGSNQHGNVVFKVKTKSTLVAGNTVTNSANIYFDYNFPILTNTVSTTFQTLSTTDFVLDNSVVVSPNPAKNNVVIKSDNNIKSIDLFDVQGRILTTKIVHTNQSVLDISNYMNGIYFVKVTTENGIATAKIIKQ